MEIKNGIIIDGVLHELCVGICDECSLQNECDDSSEIICDIAYENPNMDQCFVNRGKVTDIKTDKENNYGIYNTVFYTQKYTGTSERAGRVGI